MLRNPSDQPQAIHLILAKAMELPDDLPAKLHLNSPYKDQRLQTIAQDGSGNAVVTLQPFEVLVFDVSNG